MNSFEYVLRVVIIDLQLRLLCLNWGGRIYSTTSENPEEVKLRNIRFNRYLGLSASLIIILTILWLKSVASNTVNILFDSRGAELNDSQALAYIGIKHGISEINYGRDSKTKDCMIHIIILANYRYYWSLRDKRVISYNETFLNSVQQQLAPPNIEMKFYYDRPIREPRSPNGLDNWIEYLETKCR